MEEYRIKVGPALCIADGLVVDPAYLQIESEVFELESGPQDFATIQAYADRYFGKLEAAFNACGVPF